jgi:hypothetical protein
MHYLTIVESILHLAQIVVEILFVLAKQKD